MRIFKRFTLYVLSIILVTALVSAAFLIPWMNAPTDWHDQSFRRGLAGQIDTLVIGQSYAMTSIIPDILDEKLGTMTYNLCGPMMPLYGQSYLAEKELERNPVRHVILEITPDTLTSDEHESYGNGDSYMVARLDSFGERIRYLMKYVPLKDWPNIYARNLMLALRYSAFRLLGRAELLEAENRGFNPQQTEDVSGDAEWAQIMYQSGSVFAEPIPENVSAYEKLLSLCLESGADVILIYTPVSHAKVWELYDQESFRKWALTLAEKYGVPFFDFNLLKSRYTLFSDEYSFHDDSHLSSDGAAVFSEVLADMLARYRNGQDVSEDFYSNYHAAIQDSVYWKLTEQKP